MPQLEYTCTEAELKEVQSLDLHRQFGGGPKWRSGAIYGAFIVVLAALLLLRFKTDIAPKDRLWFIALVIVIFIALQIFKRMTRPRRDRPVRLEISEQELVFTSVGSRTAMRWSAFSQCLESPALFVLLNNSRTVLWPVPKRAFPDEKSMSWFRTLANQPLGIATAPASEVSAPGRSAARGIALTVQLGYRDHLVRMLTSWRTRGIVLVLLAILTGASLFSFVNPPPDAVVPPGKVFRMMMETMIPMLAAVLFLVSFIAWRSEKKHLRPPQVALTSEGIEFADRDNGGLLALSLPRSFRAG